MLLRNAYGLLSTYTFFVSLTTGPLFACTLTIMTFSTTPANTFYGVKGNFFFSKYM